MLAAVFVVTLAATRPSSACVCGNVVHTTQVVPRDLQSDVPINALLAFVTEGADTYPYEDVVVQKSDGTILEVVVERRPGFWTELGLVRFAEDLPTETMISVFDADANLWFEFTTGTGRDEDAPVWSSVVERTSSQDQGEDSSCGYYGRHSLNFMGVEEGPNWQTIVHLVPEDERFGKEMWSPSEVVTIEHGDCTEGDPTLEERFHRRYQVSFMDGEGNESEMVVVSTCGCASSGPAAGWWLLGGLCSALARRSASADDRKRSRRPPEPVHGGHRLNSKG